MAGVIGFALSNFPLTALVIGVIAAAVALARGPRPVTAAAVVDALFGYFLLLTVGFAYLYNFVMHVFFGAMAARFIGWADSPFQAEVGYASLGFALVGFLAFRGSFDMRLAAVIGPAMFLWGAAIGHVYQIATTGNLAPGNAGVVLYMDILLPVIGFILLWLQYRTRAARQAAAAPRR